MVFPQAYHITFGVYMGRPPGSSRPHVDKDHNQYGQPLAPIDPEREQWAKDNAKESPVKLTLEQRKCVEAAIIDIASSYGWIIYSICANFDHVHVVIGAPREGDQLRDAVKAVASKWLNKQFGKRTWWAEGGSSKYLWDNAYFHNAVKYVKDQREF
jgi:REP element-mobilizing transposase RayT